MQTSESRRLFNLIEKFSYGKIRKLASEGDTPEYAEHCDKMLDMYDSPNDFLKWNEYVKFCLINGCATSMIHCMERGDARCAVACTSFRTAIKNMAPARYLSKEIAESFGQTPLPELPLEVLDVLPFVHLMLPRNTLFDHEGHEVLSILIESGKLYADEIDEKREEIAKTFFSDSSKATKDLLGAMGIQVTTLTKEGVDVFQEFLSPDAKSWHDSNVKYADDSKYTSASTEKVLRIAINSLLVHLYEPELITSDPRPLSKGVGFSSKKKQPLSPIWIGKTFKRISQKRDQIASDVKSSVRSHWRRGHWHTVLFGKGRQERRVQWFRPVFVNPPS